jgi:hypothetical protein
MVHFARILKIFKRVLNVRTWLSAPRIGVQLRPNLTRKIKIRAAHEVMAARTTQLARFTESSRFCGSRSFVSQSDVGNFDFGDSMVRPKRHGIARRF